MIARPRRCADAGWPRGLDDELPADAPLARHGPTSARRGATGPPTPRPCPLSNEHTQRDRRRRDVAAAPTRRPARRSRRAARPEPADRARAPGAGPGTTPGHAAPRFALGVAWLTPRHPTHPLGRCPTPLGHRGDDRVETEHPLHPGQRPDRPGRSRPRSPPQNPSWRPIAGTTSSGTSRSNRDRR